MKPSLAKNYNRYGYSLLEDADFRRRLDTILSVAGLLEDRQFHAGLKALIAKHSETITDQQIA